MSSTSSSMSQCGLSPPREATALVFEDQHYSFAQLSVLADGLAAGLRGRGVTAGDRVALMASNRPEFVVALHAIWRLAAAVVPLVVCQDDLGGVRKKGDIFHEVEPDLNVLLHELPLFRVERSRFEQDAVVDA